MTEFLIRRFVKDHRKVNDLRVREGYGVLSSLTGLVCNLLLSAAKFAVGVVSGSIAVSADAFNNLSDAFSCLVTLVGFKLSAKPADREHPFGHGRMEYLAGLFIALAIMLVGVELIKSSVGRILRPAPVTLSAALAAVLAASVLLKLWMCLFNRRLAGRIGSAALRASSVDSASDAAITLVTLLSLLLSRFVPVPIDGYVGLGVALIIIYAGLNLVRDTVDPLLGQAPDPALVENIRELILSHPEIIGMHDLIVHSYGPGRVMASAHAEIDASSDILSAHDAVDLAEKEVFERFGVPIVLHLDPVDTGCEAAAQVIPVIERTLTAIDPGLSFHDLRVVPGPTHTNLVFDVCVPHGLKVPRERIKEELERELRALSDTYCAVVTFEAGFI